MLHMHYLCTNQLQRAITLTVLALCPYLSIINVQRVDINVSANHDDFHHCLFKIFKRNQNVTDRRKDGHKIIAFSSYLRETKMLQTDGKMDMKTV